MGVPDTSNARVMALRQRIQQTGAPDHLDAEKVTRILQRNGLDPATTTTLPDLTHDKLRAVDLMKKITVLSSKFSAAPEKAEIRLKELRPQPVEVLPGAKESPVDVLNDS